MPLEFNYLAIVLSLYICPFGKGREAKIGYKERDTKQSIKIGIGMSKCQKEEVTQRRKREVFVYKRKQ